MIKMESVTMKFRSTVDAEKRFIRKVSKEVVRAGQDAAHVLRVMIFLHSAKDFPSVLRLYGMENSGLNERRRKKAGHFLDERMMSHIHVLNAIVWQELLS